MEQGTFKHLVYYGVQYLHQGGSLGCLYGTWISAVTVGGTRSLGTCLGCSKNRTSYSIIQQVRFNCRNTVLY